MSKNSVFCIVTTRGQAEQIVEDLRDAGFSNEDVSILLPDKDASRNLAYEASPIVGGALGWLAGVGGLAIPGVGPFIAAGPVPGALSAATMRTTVGGIAGGLIGMGVPELEARRYEGKVRGGNILLSIHPENADEIGDAERIFEDAGAQDICTIGESTAPRDGAHHHAHM